jgi:MFS family permease
VLAQRDFRGGLIAILRRDVNFRWFLVVRVLFHLATMAFGFYTIYAVRYHQVSIIVTGILTSMYMGSQILANPVMGWVGDHWGHRVVLQFGALAAVGSTALAVWAPCAEWFYLVFTLAGVSNVAAWTITMTMTIDFAGDPTERPAYVGLANTLVAPFAILAPLLGGWLADTTGYASAFIASTLGGLLAWLVLRALVRDPRPASPATTPA